MMHVTLFAKFSAILLVFASVFVSCPAIGITPFCTQSVQVSDFSYATSSNNDSVTLPAYYLNFASAAAFRNGLPDQVKSMLKEHALIEIPILIGKGISFDYSKEMFFRALRFHISGKDEKSNLTSNDASIPLPAEWGKVPKLDAATMERVFKSQLIIGNVLVVDSASYFPLLPLVHYNDDTQGSFESDVKAFRQQAVFQWAASYPWHFYNLRNETFKLVLKENNYDGLTLFVKHRFMLKEAQRMRLVNSGVLLFDFNRR
jgi:hypothetical protein